MKISRRSILALVMASVLLLALFAGCKTSPSATPTPTPTPSKAAETTPTPSEQPPEVVPGMDGWTAFDSNVKLMVPVYDRAKEGYPPVDDNYWTKWVQSEFGDKWNITVQYIPIPRGDVMATYSMLIAGKQTPTIMMEYDYPKVAQWANDGAMRTIDLEQFKLVAPDFYQAMVDNKHLGYTDINNETYFVLTERPYFNTPFTFATMARKDWQDAVGKTNPKSYAEWTATIDAIVAAKLTNLAPLGLTIPSDAYTRNFGFRDFPVSEAEWAQYSSLGNASLSWGPTKKYLQRLNSEYNKGYYSKEFELDTPDVGQGGSSQWQTDFVNGKVYEYGGYMSGNVAWLTAFYENNPGAELAVRSNYYSVEPGVADYPQLRADNPFGMIVGFSSLATEDELKAAWMYMEWMLQKETLDVIENGVEGVTFDYNEDGLPVVKGDYRGPEMLNHNMNIDMTCVVHASKKVGTIEQTIGQLTPKGIPQDFEQALIDNYYEQRDIADKGWAYSDPVFAVAIESEAEYNATLLSLWKEYFATLVKCKPDEFEAKYADLSQKYLDAGYKEIIEERLEAYNNGNTTKLVK